MIFYHQAYPKTNQMILVFLYPPFSDITYFVTVGAFIPGIVGQKPTTKTTTSFSIGYDSHWWYSSWWIAMGY